MRDFMLQLERGFARHWWEYMKRTFLACCAMLLAGAAPSRSAIADFDAAFAKINDYTVTIRE